MLSERLFGTPRLSSASLNHACSWVVFNHGLSASPPVLGSCLIDCVSSAAVVHGSAVLVMVTWQQRGLNNDVMWARHPSRISEGVIAPKGSPVM